MANALVEKRFLMLPNSYALASSYRDCPAPSRSYGYFIPIGEEAYPLVLDTGLQSVRLIVGGSVYSCIVISLLLAVVFCYKSGHTFSKDHDVG